MRNIFSTRRAFLTQSLDLDNTLLGETLLDQELITTDQLDHVRVSTRIKLKLTRKKGFEKT